MFPMQGNQPSGDTLYVDDVFSAYLYPGPGGGLNVIENGIDLAGKGGLVWTKPRNAAGAHQLRDSERGIYKILDTASTDGQVDNISTYGNFLSSGYQLIPYNDATGGRNYVSWTFRKAPKFFDVVTYTGNGTSFRKIQHSLGVIPGMVICKRTDSASDWAVWHKGPYLGSDGVTQWSLNGTAAAAAVGNLSGNFTSTEFTADLVVATGNVHSNQNGATYVAYLFAHDTAADGMIQCGSFSHTNGSVTTVDLGWEPQFVIRKTSSTGDTGWGIFDAMRGLTVDGVNDAVLLADSAGSESSANLLAPTATGFQVAAGSVSATYIYLAIRRPNKPPTTGTQVYSSAVRGGNGGSNSLTVSSAGFAPDVLWVHNADQSGPIFDRLRGVDNALYHRANNEESSGTDFFADFTNTGFVLGTQGGASLNTGSVSFTDHFFKRAPGVFDQICFTGTGANKTEAHNLGTAPELWLVKSRSAATAWVWGSSLLGATQKVVMPSSGGAVTDATAWNSTAPTASVLSLGTAAAVNASSSTFVAYLWATKVGVSKVFAYVGNDASQTIDCGFTTGARMVLIFRTSSPGSNFFLWNYARGIVDGTEPYLRIDLNSAQVTTTDSIDQTSVGFVVNQNATSNINVIGVNYIGLAFA